MRLIPSSVVATYCEGRGRLSKRRLPLWAFMTPRCWKDRFTVQILFVLLTCRTLEPNQLQRLLSPLFVPKCTVFMVQSNSTTPKRAFIILYYPSVNMLRTIIGSGMGVWILSKEIPTSSIFGMCQSQICWRTKPSNLILFLIDHMSPVSDKN